MRDPSNLSDHLPIRIEIEEREESTELIDGKCPKPGTGKKFHFFPWTDDHFCKLYKIVMSRALNPLIISLSNSTDAQSIEFVYTQLQPLFLAQKKETVFVSSRLQLLRNIF